MNFLLGKMSGDQMKQSIEILEQILNTYGSLEDCIREDLSQTMLSYREVAAIVGWSHTQIWSFHKQSCRLQFEVLDRLSVLFHRPYLFTNVSTRGQNPVTSIDELVQSSRLAIGESLEHGISYRKIGRITSISHEWVRCFHAKDASIDVRKLISIADYLGVPYELSNEKALKRQTIRQL